MSSDQQIEEKKPERRDFRTEYTIYFNLDDCPDSFPIPAKEVVGCDSWQEVEQAVRNMFPLACFSDEWSPDKIIYPSRNSRSDDPHLSVGWIERHQPEYEAAMTNYEMPHISSANEAHFSRDNSQEQEFEECMICSGPADLECEECGEFFCSASCARQHGCS